jgi:hypothetical protein
LIAWSKRLEALGTAATGNQKAADTEQTQGVNIGLITMTGIPTPPRKRLVHLVGSGDSVGPFSEPSRICHSFTETAISTLSAIGVNPTGMRVDPL